MRTWLSGLRNTWRRRSGRVVLQRVEDAVAVTRPAGLGLTYAEEEYQAQVAEQESVWLADGERAARPNLVRAAGLAPAVEASGFVLQESEQDVAAARANYQDAVRVLGPHVRRDRWAKLRHLIGLPVLIFGDTAGVWSAAITNGDVPYVAFGQAFAAGLAAVCAGLVGAELKNMRLAQARRRDPETLSADELRYRHLFTATDRGVGIVKLIGLLSLLVVLMLAVGIGTLRSSIEGEAAGLTFGLLAAATAVASLLLGYSAADEVADLLEHAAKRAERAERHHRALIAALPARPQAEAREAARSLQVEHQLRGQAAGYRAESLEKQVLRRNPHVVGHGYPADEASGVIGRRHRRHGHAA